MSLTRQAITIMALGCVALLCTVAQSQESSEAEADLQARSAPDEEIVIFGRNPAVLRDLFRRAEEAVYQRFNEINSNDEFDIHCREEQETGSRIPRRVCQANFWRHAQASAGTETARAMQGGPALDPQFFLSEAMYKRQLFAEELRRLAGEDEQLLQALVRFATLQAELEGTTPPGSSAPPTSARETAAGEEALPYGATSMAEVHIGREPWSHVLTQRTFAIAQVYGEISALEVNCAAGRTQRLQWERGVEWTLPDDWGRCTLLVRAAPRTTFALYEFE